MTPRVVLPIACLFILAFGGYVKGTWPLNGLPIDLTLAAAAGALAGALQSILSPGRRYPVAAVATIVLLVTAMTLGLMHEDLNSYAFAKRLDVVVVLPACLLGGILLLDSARSRRTWLTAILFLGPLLIALAVLMPAPLAYGRLWPEGSSTIAVGRTAGASLIVAWCLILSRKRVVAMLLLAPLLVGGMVLSESRGPMAAALLALIVVSLSAMKNARRTALLGSAGVGLVAGAALAAKPERFTSLTDPSASIRFQLWEQTLSLSASHPVLGIGWGNLYDHQDPGLRLDSGTVQYPHNVPLEIASEAGLLALAVFLLAAVLAMRSQWRAARLGGVELAMLGLLIFFFANSLVSGDIGSNREMWVALGCAWGGRELRRTSSPAAGSSEREPQVGAAEGR